MPLRLFHSDFDECLKRLAKGAYASGEERDELLQTLLEADNLKAGDVAWMAFRPDRVLRETSLKLLAKWRSFETVDQLVAEARGKSEAALRAGSQVLFSLQIPGVEGHIGRLVAGEDAAIREAASGLVAQAPVTAALEPLLWRLVDHGSDGSRLSFLQQLANLEMSREALPRWQRLARDENLALRSQALTVLAERAPEAAADEIVEQLACVDYATQQQLINALSQVARSRGPEFVERLLPLMASGEAGIRSAVIKILLGLDNRHELVKRYLKFSTTLAGWARDRALDSMKEFGDDLVEPTIELLSDPDEEVRALALVVASSFDDPRIIPATIGLLQDEDWWLRVNAADTLGRFNDPRAVDALVSILDDNEARWAAVEALGRIADGRSLPALAKLLNDPAPEIRIEVLLALRNFKHPKIMEALHRVASSDVERTVRARALEIAEKVARRDNTSVEDADRLRAEVLKVEAGQNEPRLHALLVGTRNQGASDLHLAVSCRPTIRLGGELVAVQGQPFSADQIAEMIREILSDDQWQRLQADKQLDLCYYIPRAGRYRSNLFLDHRGYHGVFRVIPEQPPTIYEIGLPGHLAEIADFHQGLVLICGPSGCGKSTTLAALVNLFNETRQSHIITLEEPVEFVHPFKNCLINQREVGSDTRSYARALRAALRENPDVIVIGDLRDNETVSLALTAAETGHIVLGTLNSTTAPKAVDRVISSFSHDERPQVRMALAESLKYVIAQRLLPVAGARRQVACFEVLKGNLSMANLIREEKTYQLQSVMQVGRSHGMQTFDDSLRDLLRANKISAESAYLHAAKKEDFESLVSPEFLEERIIL